MKKNVHSLVLAVYILTVLMSGCALAPTSVPPAITPSPIPPTITPSPIPPTPIPSTFTPEPTSTAMQVPMTMTETPGNLSPLRKTAAYLLNLTTTPTETPENRQAFQEIGCISISDLKNTYTPLEIFYGMLECVNQDNYPSAVFFTGLAGIYMYYDTLRVADVSAHAIKSSLGYEIFSYLTDEEKEAFSLERENTFKNPENLSALCDKIIRIGAPQYYPDYMIQHGMQAFLGSNPEDALVKDFDSDAAWKKSLDEYIHCPNLTP